MNTDFPKVIEGGLGDQPVVEVIASEIPDAPVKLSAKERKLWEHVTSALKEYGLIHRTDGMLMTIICKTFLDWVAQEEFLQNLIKENGSVYHVTGSGYPMEHPAALRASKLRRDLLRWLPEAALTIPSFHKIKGEQLTPQGDLFGADPIEQFRQRKQRMGLRAIPGGKPNDFDGGDD